MTFWAHLNCCYYGWRQMMSLPIRPQPLRKLPVVWHCPCHTAKQATFLLLFSVCVPLCVCLCALYSFMCSRMKWVTSVGRWGRSRSPRGCLWVTPSRGSPRPDGLAISLSAASAKHKDRAKSCAVQEQSARERDCKPVNIMLYLDTYSALTALTRSSERRRITKASSGVHLCFVDCSLLSKLLQNCGTVTPLLTNVLLWIPGADIVQWLMKNLSVEDPGMPAEQSVITCKHNRARLKRKAISNRPLSLSHVNSWSHPPWESGRCPRLHLPHLWPRPDA